MDILSIAVAVVVGIVTGVLASVVTAASHKARDRRARRLEASKLLLTYLRTLKDHKQGLEFYQDSDYWIKGTTTEQEIEAARRAAFPVKGYLSEDAQVVMSWILYIDGPHEASAVFDPIISKLEPAIAKAFPRSFYR